MRGKFFPALLALAWMLAGSVAGAVAYRPLEKGLEYGILQPEGAAKVHLLKVDLARFQVKVLDARDLKRPSLPVKDLAERTRALAAINANFFDGQSKPLGLVLQDGKLKNPPKKISWWASLLLKGHEAKIDRVTDPQAALVYENAVQAGPRLVVAGRTLKLKEEFSPKSAVGIDRHGKLVLIATEGGMEINRFAQLLAKKEKDGGVGLVQALNLDGGSSTQLFAKAGDVNLWIPGFSSVPIALGVFRR